MPDYTVTACFNSSVSGSVTADTPDQAADKAGSMDFAQPMLCHQCSREIELGDCNGFVVDDGVNIVFDDTASAMDRKALESMRDKLVSEQQAAAEQYEKGHKIGFIAGVIYAAGITWAHDSVGSKEMLAGALGPGMRDLELGAEYDLRRLIESRAASDLPGLHRAWQIARRREMPELAAKFDAWKAQ